MLKKKLNGDLLYINEFAELVGITVHRLQRYDIAGMFKPVKRGSGSNNSYRLYSLTQITTIKFIRVLSEIGVPLKTIKELAADRTPVKLAKLIKKLMDGIAQKAKFLNEIYDIMATYYESLLEAITASEEDITAVEMREKHIIFGGINDFSGEAGFWGAFTRFCNARHSQAVNTCFPVGGYFESMEAFLAEPSKPAKFFTIDPKGDQTKEAGLYLTGYTRGYYGQTNGLQNRMAAFAKRSGLIFNGPVYNIYVADEISTVDHNNYLLQVSVPVIETKPMSSSRHGIGC